MPAESAGTSADNPLPELCGVAPQPQRGILQAFIEMVDLSAPEEVAAAALRARIAFHLAQLLGYEPLWKPVAAARLLHLGRIAFQSGHADVPETLVEVEPETGFFPELGARILSHVEMLGDVALIMAHHQHPERLDAPLLRKGAEIVRSACELQRTLGSREFVPSSLSGMSSQGLLAGATEASAAASPSSGEAAEEDPDAGRIHEVRVMELRPKMVTAAPIMSRDGKVLLAKGYLLTPRVIALLVQAASERGVVEPVRVYVPHPVAPVCDPASGPDRSREGS